MKSITRTIILVFLLAGCSNKSEKYAPMALEDEMVSNQIITKQNSDVGPPAEKPSDKKIIRTGTMNLQVENMEEVKKDIDSLVKKYNAYYSNESLQNTDYEYSYSLTIRIPSVQFDGFIRDVESSNVDVTFKNIGGRDVTEEFVDIETRLQNKRNYLKRYNELVSRANTIKEILEIEEKIRVIEEEIESAQGRLNYLSNQTSFSTLSLNISKEKKYEFRPTRKVEFFERLKESLSGGWFGLINFLLFILRLWPVWLIVAIFVPLWRKYRRKKEK